MYTLFSWDACTPGNSGGDVQGTSHPAGGIRWRCCHRHKGRSHGAGSDEKEGFKKAEENTKLHITSTKIK